MMARCLFRMRLLCAVVVIGFLLCTESNSQVLEPTNPPPTSEPTRSPTTRKPTASPSFQPTAAPTICTSSCPVGSYNPDWLSDGQSNLCKSGADLRCETCPLGFFKTSGNSWTTCEPCDSLNHFCSQGEKRAKADDKCTYRRSVLDEFINSGRFEHLVSVQGMELTSYLEATVRDRQAGCGVAQPQESSVALQIVRPASAVTEITITNSGGLPVRLHSFDLSEWVSLFDNTAGREMTSDHIVVKAQQSRKLHLLVKSSAIKEDELTEGPDFSRTGIYIANSDIRFQFSQLFETEGVEASTVVVPLTVEVSEPSLSLLPSDNSWTMNIGSFQRRTLALYNMQVKKIDWIAEVDFGDSLIKEWLEVSPASGSLEQGFKCTKDGQVIGTDGVNKAEIVASVNGTDVPPGSYSATIRVSHATSEELFSVTSNVKLEVLPGVVDPAETTFAFLAAPTALNNNNGEGEDSPGDVFRGLQQKSNDFTVRLPFTEIAINPKDRFGTETSQFEDEESGQFTISWLEINLPEHRNPHNGFLKVSRNPVDNTFLGDLNIRQAGLYEVSITTGENDVHVKGSPFRLEAIPRLCVDLANSEPHPETGYTCVCSAGYGRPGDSQTCEPCPTGQYRDTSMITSTPFCRVCGPGTFQDEIGATKCKQCPAGQQPNSGQSACEPCEENHVVDESSPSRTCVPCGPEYTVVNNKCVCRPEFYWADKTKTSCAACPPGAFCGYGDEETILPLSGFWRATWDSLRFIECTNPETCLGVTKQNEALLRIPEAWQSFVENPMNVTIYGDGSGEPSNSSRRTTSVSQSLENLAVPPVNNMNGCEVGFTGPMCRECSPGYYPLSTGVGCIECDSTGGTVGFFVMSLILGLAALIYLIGRTIRARGAPRRREVMVLKIVLSHLQIIALTKKFPLEWPPALSGLFSVFDILSSAGSSALSTHCLFYAGERAPQDTTEFPFANFSMLDDDDEIAQAYGVSDWVFLSQSLGYALAPLVLLLFFVLVWRVLVPLYRDCSQDPLTAWEKVIVSNIVLLIVLQPFLTRAGFEFFSCSDEIDGRSFLEAQYTIQCWAGLHKEWLALGVMIIVAYAIGIPTYAFTILYCVVRRNLRSNQWSCFGGRERRPRLSSAGSTVIASSIPSQSQHCRRESIESVQSCETSASVTGAIRNQQNSIMGAIQANGDSDTIVDTRAQYERDQQEQDALDRWRPLYGFIYSGYRRECFWWEIVIMLRKAAFATVSVILRPVGVDIQTYTGLLVLVLAIVLHVHYRPYTEESRLHFIEISSLAICFITLMCGLFIFSPNTSSSFKQACTMLIVLSNAIFFIYVFYSIRKTLHESAVKFIATSKSMMIRSTRYPRGQITSGRFSRTAMAWQSIRGLSSRNLSSKSKKDAHPDETPNAVVVDDDENSDEDVRVGKDLEEGYSADTEVNKVPNSPGMENLGSHEGGFEANDDEYETTRESANSRRESFSSVGSVEHIVDLSYRLQREAERQNDRGDHEGAVASAMAAASTAIEALRSASMQSSTKESPKSRSFSSALALTLKNAFPARLKRNSSAATIETTISEDHDERSIAPT